MTIYTKEFTSTYLYIKQHSVTKKLYFGKTTKDPEKYLGSGTHWRRHIKKHGIEHVETLWYCLFIDQEELTKFALNFSEQRNIVESKDWLNIIPENGLDGGCQGGKRSDETKLKMSIAKKGKPQGPRSDETKLKISIAKIGVPREPFSVEHKQKISIARKCVIREPHTKETKLKMSIAQKGVKKPVVTCPHCGKSGGVSPMKRWHFDKCKSFAYIKCSG